MCSAEKEIVEGQTAGVIPFHLLVEPEKEELQVDSDLAGSSAAFRGYEVATIVSHLLENIPLLRFCLQYKHFHYFPL